MAKLRIKIENLNENGGVYGTPFWVAAHDGSFDTFDAGSAASAELEAIAEDGNLSLLSNAFNNSASGVVGVVAGGDFGVPGPIDPQEISSTILDIDPNNDRYFSFASMIIPSNDAFVGNDHATAYQLFDGAGNFLNPATITVKGNDVYDAGTEVNTEQDAAFINQSAANTGIDENGVVTKHPGFIGSLGNPGGTSVILGGQTAASTTITAEEGDFTKSNTDLFNISFSLLNDINGSNNNDVLSGTASDDLILGKDGDDLLFGEGGDDTIEGGKGKDTLLGGKGHDELLGGSEEDHLFGNEGNDVLKGGGDNDTLSGGLDHDRLYGQKGDDRLYGGEGNDFLLGGEGEDLLVGNQGNDYLSGGDQNDLLIGGVGKDHLFGGNHADSLYGGEGNDHLMGQNGNDILSGGSGSDLLDGGKDNDTLFGNSGNDELYGNDGDDMLFGGSGIDTLSGGKGNDILNGGSGFDLLEGGMGDDIFVFNNNDDLTIIADFIHSQDQIDVSSFGFTDLLDLQNNVQSYTSSDGNLEIAFNNNDTLVVMDHTSLTDSDFIWA